MNEIYQWIGYTGSALIAISLMMKNIYKLRRINLVGASTFAIYGYLVSAYPVVLLNGFIAIVDVYYLIKMYKEKDDFHLMPVLDPSHPFMSEFLEYYKDDIVKFFPLFNFETFKEYKFFFILRNMMPVGIFVYEIINPKEIKIHVDYAIPAYRDLKNGKFVYCAETKYLAERGFEIITAISTVDAHKKYLKKIGFDQIGESNFVIEIDKY